VLYCALSTYSSGDYIRNNGLGGGHVAHMGERRIAYRSLVGKPVGNRPKVDCGVGRRIILK